jgi:hypothetical protein
MHRISIVLLLLLVNINNLLGVQRIHFAIPQNIFTKGEKVPFLLKAINPSYHQLPVTISVHSCKDLKLVIQQQILIQQQNPSYILSLPEKMPEGSYVITAYILEYNKPKIMESHAIIFHIIDQGISETYYDFKDAKNMIDNIPNETFIGKRRENPIGIGQSDHIKFSVDQSYFFKPKIKSEIQSGTVDSIHRLYFRSDRKSNLLAFFQHNKKPLNLFASNENGIISGVLSPDEYDQNFIVFDVFENKPLDLLSIKIQPPFSSFDFITMNSYDLEHINGLSEDATLNQKINHLLFETPIKNSELTDTIIEADNRYELNHYQEFESILLFINEVVLPVKLVRTSKTQENIEIFILSSVNKKWYPMKALLLIDGQPIQNHEILTKLVWKDINSIQLFRKIETLRKYYGSIGRNGVMEITTKKNSLMNSPKVSHIENLGTVGISSESDSRAYLKPLQFLSNKKSLTHGDRKGKFFILEFGDEKLLLNTIYEVKN